MIRRAQILSFIVLMGLIVPRRAVIAQNATEYEVKAAFLMNFTKFIDWPASSFENNSGPLSICILGSDPFGRQLDRLVAGETVGGRRLVVKRIQQGPPGKSCHVLFVSRSEEDVRSTLANLGSGILTVSDREGFLSEGGMIALVVDEQHVRFDINQRAAVRASLAINARMLNVARVVQR